MNGEAPEGARLAEVHDPDLVVPRRQEREPQVPAWTYGPSMSSSSLTTSATPKETTTISCRLWLEGGVGQSAQGRARGHPSRVSACRTMVSSKVKLSSRP